MADITARVKLVEGIQFVGESGSGHTLVMDGAPTVGGRNMGIRPMELLLIGMGGCSGIDVMEILRKGRHEVRDCEATLKGIRAETDPKVFTRIDIHFKVTGKAIPGNAVERAVKLSEEKYCSASAMLAKTAEIHFTYEVIEAV